MKKCEYLMGIGAAKAGTTLMYDLLCRHPDLRVGREKELHYFDRAENPTKSEYDALFSGDGISLDVTPIYLFYGECHQKIASALGTDGVRMIALLRDPIERARSHYNMCVFQGQEKLGFEECFAKEKMRMSIDEHGRRICSYFSRGLYASQLDGLYGVFPKENVLVLLYEDFVSRQQEYVDIICDFAGISRISVKSKHSNKGVSALRFKAFDRLMRRLSRNTPQSLKFKPLRKIKHFINNVMGKPANKEPLDARFLDELKRFYAADVARLREAYGIDTSKWRNFC